MDAKTTQRLAEKQAAESAVREGEAAVAAAEVALAAARAQAAQPAYAQGQAAQPAYAQPAYAQGQAPYAQQQPYMQGQTPCAPQPGQPAPAPENGKGAWSSFPYPLVCVIVFLLEGLLFDMWHPGWVVFLTIPIYYWIAHIIESDPDQR